jgi:riboflavin synthase
VSLTVAGTGGPRARRAAHGWFEVALIPTTLRLTTLSGLKPGDSVNLEADLISKTVVNWLRHTGPAARLPNRRRSHKSKPG